MHSLTYSCMFSSFCKVTGHRFIQFIVPAQAALLDKPLHTVAQNHSRHLSALLFNEKYFSLPEKPIKHSCLYRNDYQGHWRVTLAALLVCGGLGFNVRQNFSVASCDSAANKVIEVELGSTTEFEDGELYEIKVFGGKETVLLSHLDGKFYCTGNTCSHYGAPLHKGVSTKDHVTCPWHNAEFDLKTGKCINGPALNAIPVYSVKERNGKIFAELPSELKISAPPAMVKRDLKDTRVFAIVGSGAAALTACETLRQDGYTGRIVMFTKEAHPPYDRPVLSKNLKADIKNITLRDVPFLQNADIEFHPNTTVKRINAMQNLIELANGEKVQYDKVLVATGAEPRTLNIPGSNLANIFVLRRPEDTAKIANFAKQNSRVVVIGSSFIGMEVAAALRKQEAKVTVVGMESVPFERVLGIKVGTVFKNMLKEQGIEYIPRASVKLYRGSRGTVNGVELATGEVLQADAVVLGAGVIPNAEVVDGVSKMRDGSIDLNAFLSSNDAPNLYAAGDIATFPYFKSGDKIRIEHWDVALQHGRIAAKNMNGESVPYSSIPFFWTMLFGKSLRYAGHCFDFDDVICEGDLENYQFVAYYVKNEKIVAAATMGMDPAAAAICEALKLNLMPSVAEIRLGFANSKTIIDKLKEHNKRKLPKKKN